MKDIRGKKALVTGAASGIGRAIALALAREGADVFLTDLDAEGLAAAADEIRAHGVNAPTAVCDLSDPAAIRKLVQTVLGEWGGLSILINNAGLTYYGPTHAMTDEQWGRIMSVNLLAPVQLVRALLPSLLAADEAHIVNVCSMFGLVPWRKVAAYQTTKYGLVGFTQALRTEYQRPYFGVTAVCPGFVTGTSLRERANAPEVPAWICASPETVAAKTIRAIKRNRGLVLVTPTTHLYWRVARFAPQLVDWLLREGWRRRGRIEG
jgi:3-oxoacyl-[acyl-carrier protein] reductase